MKDSLIVAGMIISWVIIPSITAIVAKNKGRSQLGWAIFSVLIWPLAVTILFALPDATRRLIDCPLCGKESAMEATTCASCGYEFKSHFQLPRAKMGRS